MLSPSSINLYKQCPRKWYYRYVKRMKTLPSIHLTRGTIAHSALEDFYQINLENFSQENYKHELKGVLFDLFNKHWNNKKEELESLNLTEEQIQFYYMETIDMLTNWFNRFLGKFEKNIPKFGLVEGFNKLKPKTEVEYISWEKGVKGFIDAVHEEEKVIRLMDYKTSAKDFMTEEYKLQLAIYAMLYEEKHGIKPTLVGIDFLRHGEKNLFVDETLIEFAKAEVEIMHLNTESEDIQDYPKNQTPLCKWSTGQCDFYEHCSKE